MRDQRAGQATFIPLDSIQVKPINDKFRTFAKGARLAVDVIQFDPSVERAMHHACGSALVCDTAEIARYICYEKGQEVKGSYLRAIGIHSSQLNHSHLKLSHWKAQLSTKVVLLPEGEAVTITQENGMRRKLKVGRKHAPRYISPLT
jgi:chromosome segregation ATPase